MIVGSSEHILNHGNIVCLREKGTLFCFNCTRSVCQSSIYGYAFQKHCDRRTGATNLVLCPKLHGLPSFCNIGPKKAQVGIKACLKN